VAFLAKDYAPYLFGIQGNRLTMKEFDQLSLSEMDGGEGKPAYVACKGKVYDIGASKLWKKGLHMRIHQAGRDLSENLGSAPHGEEVLEKFPVVGTFKTTAGPEVPGKAERQMPAFFAGLLDRYPVLRRHPHPMVVHFPIVFYLASVFFNLLYLATKDDSFSWTALYCLAGAILAMPVAMLTGFLTWWLNYLARPMRPVTRKIVLSCILLAVSIIVLSWRVDVPGVLEWFTASGSVYLLLVLFQAPLVSAIGWYGATLTFPLEKKK
jgi:predicted heme/steroid binding protein/uncharacterized membrane protein